MKRTEQNQSFQTNLTQFRKSLEIGRQAWKAEADLKRSQEDRKSSRTNGKSTGISKMSKAPPSATHPGRLGIEIVLFGITVGLYHIRANNYTANPAGTGCRCPFCVGLTAALTAE